MTVEIFSSESSSADRNTDATRNQCKELAALVAQHTSGQGGGVYPTQIEQLSFIQADTSSTLVHQVYEPCLAIIVQGRKEMFLGEETYHYGVGQYLVVSVELPLGRCIADATPDKPHLGLKLTLDPMQLYDLVAQMSFSSMKKDSVRGLFVSNADTTLIECVLRLTKLLNTPQDILMLAPMTIREIYYRLLMGEQSESVRQIATSGSSMQRIAEAIKRIKSDFAKPMRIEDLAAQVSMSISSFHQHFKQVTSMSPLQYQKQLRLLEARRLMLVEDFDVNHAAYQVGYESSSHFNREYARLFGAPPMRDIKQLRTA